MQSYLNQALHALVEDSVPQSDSHMSLRGLNSAVTIHSLVEGIEDTRHDFYGPASLASRDKCQ